MKKVHVKMNKVLAALLAALLVCSSVSMSSKADTVSPAASSGEVSDGADTDAPAGGADANVSADETDAKAPADGADVGASADETDAKTPADGADAGASADVTATAEPTKAPADAEATAEPTKAPADAEATAEPTEAPAEAEATTEPTKAPAEAEATTEPTKAPADAEATTEPTKAPADAAATTEPTKAPADAEATTEPTKAPADATATAEPTKAPADAVATAKPTESPAPANAAATAAPTQSPAPANSAAVGAMAASLASANGAGISTYAADGGFIFRYNGEADKAKELESSLVPTDQWGNTKALALASSNTTIPISKPINAGTVVFDIELCPASSTTESVVLKNSNGQTLFVIRVDSNNDKVYLNDTVDNDTSIVSLGTYSAGGSIKTNFWFRLRIELYFGDSQDGVLNFRVSTWTNPEKNTYKTDISEWIAIKSITQEDLPDAYKNGTVTSDIDGSADAPFDLGSISVHTTKTKRWIGGISLYAIQGDVTLATPPGAQTAGKDFDPGEAAVATGNATMKLADMQYGVDYTVEGYTKETPVSDSVPIKIYFGGKELTATVEVKAPEKKMTGIEVKTNPDKTTYKVGEDFDKTGLVVQKVLYDGIQEYREELDAASYEVSAPDMSSSGSKTVTVTYKDENDNSFTCTFRIKIQAEVKLQPLFTYEGKAENLDELGLTGDTAAIELNTTTVAGNDSQKLKFTAKGAVTKSWDALTKDIVKINVEFNENGKDTKFRICDKAGKVLINFGQFNTKGNINLYFGQDTSGQASTLIAKKGKWIRMETEIDLTASNKNGVLEFTTNIFSKDTSYTDAEWVLGATVTQENYLKGWTDNSGNELKSENGCATDGLEEFNVASIVMEASAANVCFGNIEVLVPEKLPSQSFYYIDQDQDDISNLKLEAAEGVLAVVTNEKGSNETNKLQITKGTVKKTLDREINSGTVTLETAGYQNGAVFGIKILDSEGNALINYSQQTSGNLNTYKGTKITGDDVAAKGIISQKNKWIRVVTKIDLDASNEKGVLQFDMDIYYKDAYTDDEWKLGKSITQQEAYVAPGVKSGCATEGLTSYDIKEIQFETDGTSYVDDIYFNDGNGIPNIVTTTKFLEDMEITKSASKLEFTQGSELNTAGLELTGTYRVEYSDGREPEIKKYKINRFEAEYDFSEIKDESIVTIKVKDNGQEFTVTYKVKVTAKPDGTYVTFSYTDEESAALVGFDGSKIGVTSGDIGANDDGNTSKMIKLNQGSSTLKLTDAITSGTVHFETEFLTTASSGASLFMRILNSEGYPMVDIAQYGSSNMNLYLDKNTKDDYAHRFGGLPVKQWARAEIDIDLDKSKELNQLVFEAVVWTTDDYGSEQWTKFAEYDQNVYINGNGTVHSANGSASTKATKFDVASIELQNAGGTNYYDNMFFEAINGKASKVLTGLEIVSPAQKTTYNVGDKANTKGLVLNGTYEYTFSDGSKKQTEARIMKFTASLDSSEPGENVPVTISAGGQTVTYPVTVLPNGNLAQIEEYLVDYVGNVLVTLGDDGEVKVNKRQILLPSKYENGETLNWEVVSGTAELAEGVLTVIPSEDGATEVVLLVTMLATNEDGDEVEAKKEVRLAVPKDSKQTVDDSMTTEESIRTVLEAMYARGLFSGQANMKDVDAIMAGLDRDITTEEIAVMLVNLFDIDTTYADTRINRGDVEDDAWYSKYVKAAFQLSVETRDSREGKKDYGIGQGISEANLRYMVDRIVKIDQTTLPSNYADCMFE